MRFPRIVFLHGLESGPHGRKVVWLRPAGFEVVAPALDTSAVMRTLAVGHALLPDAAHSEALRAAAAAVRDTSPDVLVGSSFGGGLFGREQSSGGHCRAVVVHGRRYQVVAFEDSLALTANSPGEMQLWLVDDDHCLAASVEGGVLGRAVRAAVE